MSDTTQTIYQKILAITAELGAISKDSKNDFHKYSYRSVDAVMNQLHPLLVKHNVLVFPNIREKEHKVLEGKNCIVSAVIEFTFVDAVTGEKFICSTLAEGADNGDKASYKAMSGAIKYALFQTLMIPTEDDPDKESPSIGGAPNKPKNEKPTSSPNKSDDTYRQRIYELSSELGFNKFKADIAFKKKYNKNITEASTKDLEDCVKSLIQRIDEV